MTQRKPGVDATEAMGSALKSQYHGVLAMLRQAIERCSDELWANSEYANPFWRIAYHTLYYTHLYLQPNEASFRPWEHHQTGLQDMDDIPSSPDIQDLIELPHRPPQTGEPVSTSCCEYTCGPKLALLIRWSSTPLVKATGELFHPRNTAPAGGA